MVWPARLPVHIQTGRLAFDSFETTLLSRIKRLAPKTVSDGRTGGLLALGPALAAEDAVAAGEADGARPRVADDARLRVETDPARHHFHQLLDERNSMNAIIVTIVSISCGTACGMSQFNGPITTRSKICIFESSFFGGSHV